MIYRVTPAAHPDEPVYMSQRVNVPEIEENAHGDAYLQGSFDVGEGKYHVDWLMRDRSERVCSAFWDVGCHRTAEGQGGDVGYSESNTVAAAPTTSRSRMSRRWSGMRMAPPLQGQSDCELRSAGLRGRGDLQPLDMNALISILRRIAREPRIGTFSIVAFNLQERRVVYRQENSSRIDFPALGEAVNSLNLGTVDVKRLSQKRGETEFLTNLFTAGAEHTQDHPDAVIFAGPKVLLDGGVPQESLKKVGGCGISAFLHELQPRPASRPVARRHRQCGEIPQRESSILSPGRAIFGTAWGDIMSRIVKSKLSKRAANGASQ